MSMGTLIGLLIAVVGTVIVIWLAREKPMPNPIDWVVYIILIAIWIWVIISALGLVPGVVG